MTTPTPPERTTVLIVGGGPVGLLLAILLDRQGVDSIVVERRDAPQVSPAAHVVNARTFEICRAAGLDGALLDAACQPAADGAWVRWVTSLAGDELGAVPFEGLHDLDALTSITPTPLRNLSQHRFEPILRDHVEACASAQLLGGVEWRGAVDHGADVVSTVADTATGETTTITSSYLVGADGAGSPVRRAFGIEMQGPTRLQAFLSIHAEVDLRALVGERPATLYWIVDPEHPGVFVAHDLGSTWVFMHTWDPDTERLDDYPSERCASIFARALGRDDVAIEVRSVTPWMMTCQVADRYRQGRVLLVGDAAHRFPPTGGLGLNTGAADAQNLAWKLGAIERGWAGPALLDTYDAERRAVAERNAEQSLHNALKLVEVGEAWGVDDDPATTKANLAAAMASADGRARIHQAIDDQAAHFDGLGLQLGFTYDASAGAVVHDGTPPPVATDPVRAYVPTTRPGARLPHAWIERDGEAASTLDLVPPDRFVLLTSSEEWAAAAEKVGAASAIPLAVVRIGEDAHDPAGAWAAVSELGDDGAVLVRPDQHVGWRSLGAAPDPVAVLEAALDAIVRPA